MNTALVQGQSTCGGRPSPGETAWLSHRDRSGLVTVSIQPALRRAAGSSAPSPTSTWLLLIYLTEPHALRCPRAGLSWHLRASPRSLLRAIRNPVCVDTWINLEAIQGLLVTTEATGSIFLRLESFDFPALTLRTHQWA